MSEGDHVLAQILEFVSDLETYIPGVRSWVGEILIGKIPLTDEVTVYELADLWGDVQTVLDGASTDAQNVMAPLLESWTGDTAMQFGQWWQDYLEKLNSLLQNAAQTQEAVQNFGLQIETMKFMAVIGLIMMAVTIFQLVALAWGTLGISAVGVVPTIKATGVALARVAENVLASIAKISWESVGTFFLDLIRLSPKQIVARSVADSMLADAGKFVPEELLSILAEKAPTAAELVRPGLSQFQNELREALIQAQLRAWEQTGTSLAATGGEDLLGQWAGRQIGEQTFGKALWLYLRPRILNGIGFMGGGNLLAQLFEVAGGERKGLDLGELGTNVAQGAVFGAAMWGSPLGHVLGSAAASSAFALAGDALKGGVDEHGNPVDWWGDAWSAARSGAEAGVVFGLHAKLPELDLGTEPTMPEGGRLTGIGDFGGVLTLGIEGEGTQLIVRPDYVVVTDKLTGAQLIVRSDGAFASQGEFVGSENAGFRPVEPVGPVVEADPPGTVYEQPTASAMAGQGLDIGEEFSSPELSGQQLKPVVVESEPQTRPIVVESEPQTRPVVVESEPQQKPAVVESEPQTKPVVAVSEPRQKPVMQPEPSPEPAATRPESRTASPRVDLSKLTSQARVPEIESKTHPPLILNQAEPPEAGHQPSPTPVPSEPEVSPSGPEPLTITLDSDTVAHLDDVLGGLDEQPPTTDPDPTRDLILPIRPDGPMVSIGPESGANQWHIVIPAEPNRPARILEIGAGTEDLWLGLMSDFSQPGPNPDRAIPDPALVALTRSDLNSSTSPVRIALNAEQKIPQEYLGTQDAVIVNNNFDYHIQVGLLGEALRDGGLLIVQSRAQEPGSRSNPFYRFFYEAMLHEQANPGSELPPGYRLVSISSWPTHPVKVKRANVPPDISRGPRPPDVLGDGFHTADANPRPLGWPNSRIVIEKVDLGRSPTQAVLTLLEQKYSAGLISDIGTDYGEQSLAAAAAMAERGVPQKYVMSIVERAFKADVALREYVEAAVADGRLGPVHIDLDRQSFTNLLRRAFDSGTIVNLEPQKVQGLARTFVAQVHGEAKVQDLGHHAELLRAVELAEQGKVVGIAGVEPRGYSIDGVKAKLTPGKADVIVYDTHTSGEAIQRKSPPTADVQNTVMELKSGVEQIKGERGEIPPKGFRRVVELEIQNPDNPLYTVDRDGFLHQLEQVKASQITTALLIKDGAPITIRVFNGHGTFELGPADFGPPAAGQAADVFARIVDVETALHNATTPGDIDPNLIEQLRDAVNATLLAGPDLGPEQIRRLKSLELDLEAIKNEVVDSAGRVRALDGLERNLLSGTMVKIAHTLAGGVPDAADPMSSPSQPSWITPGTDKYVNQLQGSEFEPQGGMSNEDVQRQIQNILEIADASKKEAEAHASFNAENARIKNAAAAETARTRQAMQAALDQGNKNLPAMQAALDASNAKLGLMRARMFGEAVVPPPEKLHVELAAQQQQLQQLDVRKAEAGGRLAALKEGGGALATMAQVIEAGRAWRESARQNLVQYEELAVSAPTDVPLLMRDTEQRWVRIRLDSLVKAATGMVRDADELQALVEHALRQGSPPNSVVADLFAEFGHAAQKQADAALQDALRVHQYLVDNDLMPLLEGGSDRLTAVWTEQRDGLIRELRNLRVQLIDLQNNAAHPDTPARTAVVEGQWTKTWHALRAKELALREQWLKDPDSLPALRSGFERQISDLRAAMPEAWRRGEQAVILAISDDLNRAEGHLAWIDRQLAQAAPTSTVPDLVPLHQALAKAPPAFEQRFGSAEEWSAHLAEKLSMEGLQDTWLTWEQRRRGGYVDSINELLQAQADLNALHNDPAAEQAAIEAQQALVHQLAVRHAEWQTRHPGDVPEHNVGAGFRDVAVPGLVQLDDLKALGNPKDWPVAVDVEKIEEPPTNFYHAHRNVLKDFATAQTAAPDVIGGRLPVELYVEDGHWRVQLSDGTVLDVRSHKPVSLVIDSGPVWRGGLSMLRLDSRLGDVGPWWSTPGLPVKVGPLTFVASVGGGVPSVDLQYNPVLRRDFYTYEDVGAQTLDIKVLSDPNKRFPDTWQITTPGQGKVLTGVEKTLQFYTKWGVQGIVVPMIQVAFGDPAHGLDSLVPFLQIGGVGLGQITGEVVSVSDAVTRMPLRTEWSVSAEWLVGDFISLPSRINGVPLHPDVRWLLGWDPGPGTVMTNHVRGVDLTPFVKQYGAKLLAKTPWIGDAIQRRVLERQQAEAARLAALQQHEDEVRQRVEMLKRSELGEGS